MKTINKILLIFVLIFISFITAACGNKNKEKTNNPSVKQNRYDYIDIDLSKMNDTMKIAQVNQIMNDPASYDGKVIKAKGEYKVYYSSLTDQYYPSIVISDSTACCAQTFEFILKDYPTYPEGYPEVGCGIITIVGVFERYFEDTKMYVHLINTEIL